MRSRKTLRQSIGVFLSLLAVLINYSPQMQAVQALPESLQVRTGEVHALSIGWPFVLSSTDNGMQVLASTDESTDVMGALAGETKLTVSMFGVPVKNVTVAVAPERMLIPGGQSIGAALSTRGVLVVGASDSIGGLENPAKAAGIRVGDLILAIDGQEVKSASHLTELVSRHNSNSLSITFDRNGSGRTVSLQPAKDAVDGRMRLGLWVRDSTAGVGTLSYYDPVVHSYGALGHAISDVDTGVTLPVREGSILESTVVGIRKGERGNPGELQGTFLRDQVVLGDIHLNNSFGIFGKTNTPILNSLFPGGLPVASRAMVHTGPATIITTLDENGPKPYAVEITRVAKQATAAQKSMTLRVTDPELLSRTGGIVQGMSGSPIIQDGRIIGAVTHVFVNDPTQGYGMFIEWMLEQSDQV